MERANGIERARAFCQNLRHSPNIFIFFEFTHCHKTTMDILHGFLANALEYISFYQMKELAHTCAFARDLVLAWLRAHPWIISPFGDVFERSSLTLLRQITQDHRGKKVNVVKRYSTIQCTTTEEATEELIMRACRHDDMELVQHVTRDALDMLHTEHYTHDEQPCYGNLIIASLPNYFEHSDAHDFYQNRTRNARVFMYLIGCGSDGVIPFYELRAHYHYDLARDTSDLFEYIASGAVITNNETLLRHITKVRDLTGIEPKKYYRCGFSDQINPRIHELARAAGMRMHEYDAVPSRLAIAIQNITDLESFVTPLHHEKRVFERYSYGFYIDRLTKYGRYDVLTSIQHDHVVGAPQHSCNLLPIDVHAHSFARVICEVVKRAQCMELEEQCMTFAAQSAKKDIEYTRKDAMICWFVHLSGILTVPVRTVRRILDSSQYHTYMRLCAIALRIRRGGPADITYFREFDDMRITINYHMLAFEYVLDVSSTTTRLNIDHDIVDAITDLHEWIRAHPDIDAPPSLVQACITANAQCDIENPNMDGLVELLAHRKTVDLKQCLRARSYVANMSDIIRDIIAWTRFANLSKFEKFFLGMVFDNMRVMRESGYKILSDTCLGMYVIWYISSHNIAVTYDMLDFSLGENIVSLYWFVDQNMSLIHVLPFLRSAPNETLMSFIRMKPSVSNTTQELARIVFSTERS